MANLNITTDGQQYATKMDNVLRRVVAEWWDSLTKEELLTYLLEQPSITADHIRHMLSNENCMLSFGVNYSMSTRDANADFHTDET